MSLEKEICFSESLLRCNVKSQRNLARFLREKDLKFLKNTDLERKSKMKSLTFTI